MVAGGGPRGRWLVEGAGGSIAALVVRALQRTIASPIVVIVPDGPAVEALADDLRFVIGAPEPLSFDAPETSPYADVAPDRLAATRRLAALFALTVPSTMPPVMVVSAVALVRKVVPTRRVRAHSERIAVGDELDREGLLARLTVAGYLRVPLCEDPGTVSVRGALIDVWGPALAAPVRIEVDGDVVESIKGFDPTDQRTRERQGEVWLPPAREMLLDADSAALARTRLRELCDAVDWPSSKTRQLIDDIAGGRSFFGAEALLPAFCRLEPLFRQLPAEALVVVDEPSAVARAVSTALDQAESDEVGKHGEPHFAVGELFASFAELDGWLQERACVGLNHAALGGGEGVLGELSRSRDDTPSLAASDQSELQRALTHARKREGHGAGLDPLIEQIESWRGAGLAVTIVARTSLQSERMATMLRHRDLEVGGCESPEERARALAPVVGAGGISVAVGPLRRGVVAPAEGLVLLTEEEVFGTRAHREARGRTSERRARQLLEDLRSLAVGDHVVHVEHGIGRYVGLMVREVGGQKIDLLVVEYAGGDKLYVPAYRLNLVQRYRGSDAAPKLDKLGGQSFARTKARAKTRVRQMADELLRLYAERREAVGVALGAIDDEYRAFEAGFPYEETEDQARAIIEVGAELEAPRPMDRLVCGDVGFGKTEVALRAAFRVAMSGRQVAVLCPTTVLAQQHTMTFSARMAGYPIRVAALSRFQSSKRQREVVLGLRNGSIDVVIGTHRILSKDVHFKRLGLLVVDEEQRFGVAAKERIKALKTDIDVLTLTATPIPRTLQMAITGIRDLSLITTPPADRRAVRTIATRWDTTVIREAITRELDRGGQVFFVYNRIGGLGERAEALAALAPTARIAVAHGQMSETALERTMLDFVAGEHDILCSTAIIENGLDIPRCNTIIVDRADLFGMAQLYQLRGRVGRSKERGYCYLVVPDDLGDEARTRVEALQRYSDLGSGFQVASLDLDLRGSGDLRGAEQSGAIESVGIEMFCSMLDEAVRELEGEPIARDIDPELSFDVEALLEDDYVPDVGLRLSLYKRLASAVDRDEVHRLAEEMEDRFGRPPPPTRRLVQLMALKTDLRRLRVLACEASAAGTTLHLRDDTPLDPANLAAMIRGARGQWRLTPDMRLTRRAMPGDRFDSGIESTERLIDEVQSCLAAPRAAN